CTADVPPPIRPGTSSNAPSSASAASCTRPKYRGSTGAPSAYLATSQPSAARCRHHTSSAVSPMRNADSGTPYSASRNRSAVSTSEARSRLGSAPRCTFVTVLGSATSSGARGGRGLPSSSASAVARTDRLAYGTAYWFALIASSSSGSGGTPYLRR